METIQYEIRDRVATLRLNRPAVFNAFNRQLSAELGDAIRRAAADPTVRVVLLTANGKAFSAGQDLQEISSDGAVAEHLDFHQILETQYHPIIRLIRDTPKPFLCGVNGVAAGAGANIALACDIVVAAEQAAFLQAFSRIGLAPDSGGTYLLPRLVGLPRATALMMLGERIDAGQAQAMGMIYEVYPTAEFAERTWALACRLAEMPPHSMAAIKRLLSASWGNTLERQLEAEAAAQAQLGATADFAEGLAAFLQKRPPVFRGT